MKRKTLALTTLTLTLAISAGSLAYASPSTPTSPSTSTSTSTSSHSPLEDTVYWTTLDSYPKYKQEAVQMVDDLMNKGYTSEKACQTALSSLSDKIYKDNMTFIEQHPDLDVEEYEEAYQNFIYTQQH